MRHDRIVAVQIFFLPDRLEKLLGTHDPALMLAEIPEQGKFDGSERELFSKKRAAMAVFVNDEAADIKLVLFLRLPYGRIVALETAKLGLDPG